MRRSQRALLVFLAWAAFPASSVYAQSRRPPLKPPQPPPTQTKPTFAPSFGNRGFLSLGGTFQLGSSSFATAFQPIDFGERASVDTRYSSSAMPGFDIGGGAHLRGHLAMAVNVERVSKSGSGQVSANIPHPFFFNRSRAVTGDTSDLHRSESAIHLQAVWIVPMADHIDLGISGGPSWIRVSQDLVGDIIVAQTYPYDTATFRSAVAQRQSKGHLGFNAGMTLDYRFTRRLGLGLTARFSRAHVRFDEADAGSVSFDAGGANLGAGVRVRF